MNEVLNRAMRLLAQRDHSEAELRRKLVAQSASEADVEQSIAYCYEHNWLDDGRFAERYVVLRSQKGYGAQRIQQELMMKGISRTTIRDTLQESAVDWESLARKTARKRFGPVLPTDWQKRAKVQRFLLYRGFFQEEIQSVFSDSAD